MSNTMKNSQEKVVLEWNGVVLKSMKDLREQATHQLLLTAHQSGDLYRWLSQHYYEQEAAQIEDIRIEDRDCLAELCRILSVAYETGGLSHEDLAERRERLRQYTKNEEVLRDAALVALDQEELAELLDQGQTKIYLCNNTFSIPLRKPGVTYISVGEVKLEPAFTLEQYEKAGIKIKNLLLPRFVSKEAEEYAHQAAVANGYDDFADTHSALAALFHPLLLAKHRMFRGFHIVRNTSNATRFFTSKSECKRARDNCIEKAYREAELPFDISSVKCIARESARTYGEKIQAAFPSDVMASLESLLKMTGKPDLFRKLKVQIADAERNLRALFEEEIRDNADYYALYDLSYFKEMADIEEHDYRVSEEGFFRLLETIATDNVEYTIRNLYSSLNEMERDMNSRANTFFTSAHMDYQNYTVQIEELLDEAGKDLPAANPGESAGGYIKRMCVLKAM